MQSIYAIRLFISVMVILCSMEFDNILWAKNRTQPIAQTKAVPPAKQHDKFDTAQYIDIHDIKPGMVGYGLTVFHDTTIERFKVVAVSVVPNRLPGEDALLIKCKDKRFDIAKGVQGVSGSPVFFDGRLAGAMSFGWSMCEEPLYGVTPIRQMLQARKFGVLSGVKKSNSNNKISDNFSNGGGGLDAALYKNLLRDVLLTPRQRVALLVRAGLIVPQNQSASSNTGFVALPLVNTVSGLTEPALRAMQQWLPGLSLHVGVSAPSSLSASVNHPQIKLERGSTVTIPLLTGDMSGAVLGTVTEVIGNQVYAFGHAWNGDGTSSWPMGNGYVSTFVNKFDMSFKLGYPVDIVGTLKADTGTAVYGEIGPKPAMARIDVDATWPRAGFKNHFHYGVVQDDNLSATLANTAILGSLMQKGDLPKEHTIKYRVKMTFDGLAPITFRNISSGNSVFDIAGDISPTINLILNNSWKKIKLKSIDMQAEILDHFQIAVIKSANILQRIVHQGDTVDVSVILQPLRKPVKKYDISLKLPDDIPPGIYTVYVGSDSVYRHQLQSAQPQLFTAYNVDDLHRIFQRRLTIARDNLYISMKLPYTGTAIDGYELPDLPASQRALLTDRSHEQIVNNFWPLLSNKVKTKYVINGQATFNIIVRKK